jgi:hypothetical protein
MEHKIIYEKDGIIILLKSYVIEEFGDMTTLYCRIEPGAFRSVSYIGAPNDIETQVYLNFLISIIKEHYEDKGKTKIWRKCINSEMRNWPMIYEQRNGFWKWYDV